MRDHNSEVSCETGLAEQSETSGTEGAVSGSSVTGTGKLCFSCSEEKTAADGDKTDPPAEEASGEGISDPEGTAGPGIISDCTAAGFESVLPSDTAFSSRAIRAFSEAMLSSAVPWQRDTIVNSAVIFGLRWELIPFSEFWSVSRAAQSSSSETADEK